jgi:uncharacterized membrane protein
LVRLASHAHGQPLESGQRRYATVVTWLWTLYIATATVVLLLGLINGLPFPPALAGVFGLPLALVLLVLEYGVRCLVFPGYRVMSLGRFLLFLRQQDYRSLLRDDSEESPRNGETKAAR